MTPRSAIVGVFGVGVAAVGAGYLTAFAREGAPLWGAGLVAGGTVVSLVAAMALGALKGDRLGGLASVFTFVLLFVGGAFALLLLLPPVQGSDVPLILGLPLPAAVLLYGIGCLPVLLVPLAYAGTFERFTLSDADLERVRTAARDAGGGREGLPGRCVPEGRRDDPGRSVHEGGTPSQRRPGRNGSEEDAR